MKKTIRRAFLLPQEVFERAIEIDKFLWEWANETDPLKAPPVKKRGANSSGCHVAEQHVQTTALLGLKAATKGILLLERWEADKAAQTGQQEGALSPRVWHQRHLKRPSAAQKLSKE